MKLYLFLLTLLLPSYTLANHFRCTITNVSKVDDSGNIVADAGILRLGNIGEKFAVDGVNGKIISSGILANDNYGKPVVTKRGKDKSFVTLTQHQSGDVSVLKIYEYKNPMQFLYLATSSGLATGVCRYY